MEMQKMLINLLHTSGCHCVNQQYSEQTFYGCMDFSLRYIPRRERKSFDSFEPFLERPLGLVVLCRFFGGFLLCFGGVSRIFVCLFTFACADYLHWVYGTPSSVRHRFICILQLSVYYTGGAVPTRLPSIYQSVIFPFYKDRNEAFELGLLLWRNAKSTWKQQHSQTNKLSFWLYPQYTSSPVQSWLISVGCP